MSHPPAGPPPAAANLAATPEASAVTVVRNGELSLRQALPAAGLAVIAFHAAYLIPGLAWLMVFFLGALAFLTRLQSRRAAFFLGFAVGLCVYPPHLAFFYTIFHGFALCLWLVLPFFSGLFVYLGRLARRQLPPAVALLSLPLLWFGLEYFRCELWPLRFGWLTPALAFADHPPTGALYLFGGFGVSALLMALVVPLTVIPPRRTRLFFGCLAAAIAGLAVLAALPSFAPASPDTAPTVRLTGVQTENMLDDETLTALDAARISHPDTDLFVLSEYAFTGRAPDAFLNWCREHRAYLIAGGSEIKSLSPRRKYNTAFVVGPEGTILYRQVKSVPIQFFDDGLAAESQEVWTSPWGQLSMCVCYDLSFTRVVDRFAAKGSQLMVVPTMDVAQWGAHQHWLHSRVAPIRAAEYGLPLFRLCSSGISQAVSADGTVIATAPFPGKAAVLNAALLPAAAKTHLPLDRYLWPVAVAVPWLIVLWCAFAELRRRWRKFQTAAQTTSH